MKVLNLLTAGDIGGIEIINYDFGQYSKCEQGYAFLFGLGKTYDRMKESRYKVYDLSMYAHKISKERYRKLKEIASQYDIIVVHHGDPYLKLYYLFIVNALHKRGVCFIHSCWDDSLFFANNRIKHDLGKWIFQKAISVSDYVVFVSKAGEKSYADNFNLLVKKCVIYNGIGMDKISDGYENIPRGNSPYNILFIGRIEKIKGLDSLLYAIKEIRKKYSIVLTIVGTGTYLSQLQKLVKQLGIEDIVYFEGATINVKPYLREADIFVYPSVCQEVFGISIVEAMAYGLICVGNNVGGIPEIIEDGQNGFVNSSNTILGLVDTIENGIEVYNSGRAGAFCEKAKDTARKFSIENTCNALDRLYEEIYG